MFLIVNSVQYNCCSQLRYKTLVLSTYNLQAQKFEKLAPYWTKL